MTVIVESGATKSDWRLFNECKEECGRFSTAGINVSTMSAEVIHDVLAEGIGKTETGRFEGFYLYSAGVWTAPLRDEAVAFLKGIAEFDDIDINNDLVGAARAVCLHEPGIVAIMGTGSNTCMYDGVSTSQKVYSGGYVIGDDGSAAALGRLFLYDFIKGLVPEDVAEDFSRSFASDYASIVGNVYHSASPSGYLGSLAPFIVSHYDNPYVRSLVDGNFKAFIERSLKRYDTENYPTGVVGGFGYACRDIFTPLAEEAGIRISRFIPTPVEGLVEYHLKG